jgi:CheY-like chemotaxis protein
MSHSGLHVLRPNDAAPEAVAKVRLSPVRVLFVEDEAGIRDPLGEALQEDGFEVVAAANGREALELLRNGPRPFAILLDLMMPVMDGWDFRREQLDDPSLRDIPVLIFSASGFSPETIRLQFGDVELIPKPVPYGQLVEALGRACGPTAPAAGGSAQASRGRSSTDTTSPSAFVPSSRFGMGRRVPCSLSRQTLVSHD